MAKDLTTSVRERQNVLNNQYAIEKIEDSLGLDGSPFEGGVVFTKNRVADILDVDDRTIERYIASHGPELERSGYRLLRGRALKEFKKSDVSDINVGDKAPALGVFSFRTLLNLAMLLTESEPARAIRSRILDMVIDVLAERSGGHTKYINQRDDQYLSAAVQEYGYREVFTDALRDYLQMPNIKYGIYTNRIYQAVFKENAVEYKKVLKLAEKENPRDTMYAEVLRAIASFESGLAHQMKEESGRLGRKLMPKELDDLIAKAEVNPFLKPIIEEARSCMASRDLCFRDALHHKLEAYVRSVPEADFERFLGETSKTLEERLSDPETLAVFKRLKDR